MAGRSPPSSKLLHQARHPKLYVGHFVYDGGVIKSPGDCANSPRVWPNLNERSDVAKRTPLPCSAENCGDLFPRCGTTTTIYTRYKCRCDACYELQSQANKRWRETNPDRVREYREQWEEQNAESHRESTRRWQEENRERTREYARKYREENPEAVKKAVARWRAENTEAIAEYARNYRLKNPAGRREYQREYRRSNPHFHRAALHRRRALLIGAFIEDVDNRILFERDGYICAHCGIKCQDHTYPALDYATHDHIIPLSWGVSRGGFHSYANSQTLCSSCNSRKGNRNNN